ncbi:jg20188 [Pararge aegeria aegeria]|uniref:Jg20188 protein n=1 Tax=Pararge aegeria aegeria TaxID=348720 RepID=A0A8S4S2A2_9NEOP|nr:jg20188 [Pararge aegeria aegeria]
MVAIMQSSIGARFKQIFGGRTRCAQPRSKHESSSSSSLDEFKTPPTSAGDVTPPPVRRTCRGSNTRRHQYKTDDDHSTSASLGQQGLRAPANSPVTGGVVRRMRWSQYINESVMRASTNNDRDCPTIVGSGAGYPAPIVVSVNGLLAKSFDQHLKKFSLGCWIKGRIQKAVVLETARIVRRFLTLEP